MANGPNIFQMLLVALVDSRLGTTAMQYWLASVLNAVARLIYHLRPYDHISDALATLHCLSQNVCSIKSRTYKLLNGSSPRYFGPFIAVADLPAALCSARTSQLVVPPITLSTVDSRAFPVAAAQVIDVKKRFLRFLFVSRFLTFFNVYFIFSTFSKI